jgi:hypothetical protein
MCVILLTMCHVHWFNQCYTLSYTSSNWRVKSKVNRPLLVRRNRKGVFSIRRGTQSLQTIQTNTLLGMPHPGAEFNLLRCHLCLATCHSVVQCPLVECTKCHEFGHMSYLCKKKH